MRIPRADILKCLAQCLEHGKHFISINQHAFITKYAVGGLDQHSIL